MTLLTFIRRRASRHWQLLLTVIFGVLIATGLLASAPLLVNTVVEYGLRRALLTADPLAGNLRLEAALDLTPADYQPLDSGVQQIVANRLGAQTEQVISILGSRWLFPWFDGAPLADQRVQFQVVGLTPQTDIRQWVTLVDGDWPSQALADEQTATAVISEEMADAYGLLVGDRLPLSPNRDVAEPLLWLEVSGIVQATDPLDSYWLGRLSPLRSQSDSRWVAQYAVFLTADHFFTVIDTFLPDQKEEFIWHGVLDANAFDSASIPDLRGQLLLLRRELSEMSPSIAVQTELDSYLGNFAQQSTAVRAPLYFLTAEIVLLALYYVVMVAALSVQQHQREFSVLQSRGASARQLFQVQAGEAGLIALAAALIGPLLAWLLVRGLTLFGPLADVSEPSWGLSLPQVTILVAVVGALASGLALLLPVRSAVRQSVVMQQQTAVRNEKQPWWQRTYLDVFVLLAGLVLLWRLQVYGSIVGGSAARPQVDWLLLLSPLLLLLGTGTILLRLFPLLLRGLAALAARLPGLPGALALWQAARNPGHVTRLVLLLTLAMALGILTTGLNATLDTSELERSQYTAGGDVRLVAQRPAIFSNLKQVDAVEDLTGVWRGKGSTTIGRSYIQFDVLGIEPAAFNDVALYRDDFAAQPVAGLVDRLAVETVDEYPTIPVPGRPLQFGFWLWSAPDTDAFNALSGDSDLDRIGVEAKFRTAQGENVTVVVRPTETGGYPADGWRYFSADMPQLGTESYPLALESLWLRNRTQSTGTFARAQAASMDLFLDDLTVVGEDGQPQVFDDMESLLNIWTFFSETVLFQRGNNTAQSPQSSTVISQEQARTGTHSLKLQLRMEPREQSPLRRAAGERIETILPVLVSPAFLVSTETAVGDVVALSIDSLPITMEIVGTVSLFPTMYEELNGGFLITNRNQMLAMFNRQSADSVNPNEAIVTVDTAVDPEEASAAAAAAVPEVDEAVVADVVRRTIKADPMGLGLRSVTFFGYLLTTTLSLVGFATYFYMSARQRSSIYGVLRSIGMSPRQLYGTLVLEQVVLILTGLALGTGLGVLLNQITLPGLPITFGDRPPTPPFRAQSDWLAVGQIYLTLATVFLLVLGIATWQLWRTRLHRVLRIGEE